MLAPVRDASGAVNGLPPQLGLTTRQLDTEPLAVWQELRAHSPVAYVPGLSLTLVTRYDDVERVCRDAAFFGAQTPDGPLTQTLGPNFMHADGAAHGETRQLVVPLLRARALRGRHEGWLRAMARDLAARLALRTGFDVMADYAHPLAVALLSRITGVQASEQTYERWFRALSAGASNFENDPDKQAGADTVCAEIDEAVARSARDARGSGLVSILTEHGCRLAMIASTMKLCIIGGLQEPRDLLGFCVLGLIESGRWVPDVAQDRRLPRAIEEAARWGSPVGTATRTVVADTTLAGYLLPAGTRVAAVLASANHDPRRWHQPQRFDPDRREGAHVAYGSGPHTCVGAAAARLLVRIAVEELARGCGDLRVAEPPEIRGFEFRGPIRVLLGTG